VIINNKLARSRAEGAENRYDFRRSRNSLSRAAAAAATTRRSAEKRAGPPTVTFLRWYRRNSFLRLGGSERKRKRIRRFTLAARGTEGNLERPSWKNLEKGEKRGKRGVDGRIRIDLAIGHANDGTTTVFRWRGHASLAPHRSRLVADPRDPLLDAKRSA